MQVIVVLMLVCIVGSLVKAMMHMSRGDVGDAMVKALTARILMSIGLFGLLFISWHFGLMQPHVAHVLR